MSSTTGPANFVVGDNEWFKVTLSSIGDAVITTDIGGNITYVNSRAEALTGWMAAEAVGKHIDTVFQIVNEFTRKPAVNPVGRVLREGVVVGLANHTLLISKSGVEYPIDDSAAPIRNATGESIGVVLVFHDVTEQKSAEHALLIAERKFRLLVENVRDYAIFMLDPLGKVTSWNVGAERIKGYRSDEIIGTHFSRFYPGEDVQRGLPDELLKTAIRDGRVETEGWRIRKDGTRFWASVVITAVRDESGRLIGFGKVTRDMTDRKRADEQLRSSEERFRLLVDGVKDYAIFMLSPSGQIRSWNSGAERLKGYTAAEAIGQSISIFYPPEDVKAGKIERELEIATREGRYEEEGIRVRKDGSRFFASVLMTALRNANGELIGIAKITRDISERKKAEQALRAANETLEQKVRERTAELERANRMKDEFLATISHELRTPLTPMLGWIRILQNEPLDASMAKRGIQIIERNINLQTRLIEDLLDVSRIISGKLKLDLRPVGLAQIVEAALEVVRSAAEAKQISLEFKMHGSVGPVSGDSARLQQVFWNLLSNAIRFTPAKGHVVVALKRLNGMASITVIDDGEGIEPDYLPFVFDRFSQADSSSKRRYGGLGIGLSIVKQIVELHGGNVSAESKGKGLGSTFTVHLPLAKGLVLQPSLGYPFSGVATFDRLKGVKVLLVDDEADARELLSIILSQFGAEVLTVDSVRAAMAEIDRFKPTVLITDIGMPDEDGYDLLRKVRALDAQNKKKTPAVALTAFARVEDQSRAISEGFQAHLAKPVEPEKLIEAVAALSKA